MSEPWNPIEFGNLLYLQGFSPNVLLGRNLRMRIALPNPLRRRFKKMLRILFLTILVVSSCAVVHAQGEEVGAAILIQRAWAVYNSPEARIARQAAATEYRQWNRERVIAEQIARQKAYRASMEGYQRYQSNPTGDWRREWEANATRQTALQRMQADSADLGAAVRAGAGVRTIRAIVDAHNRDMANYVNSVGEASRVRRENEPREGSSGRSNGSAFSESKTSEERRQEWADRKPY
jgi:hypothetical protein